jgi:hypothetical protein
MAKGQLLLHRKRLFDDGSISEIKLWLVPGPVRGSKHTFKYSLFYGHSGIRLVGYDNESGKGDHRYRGEREEAYQFTTPEKLIADFLRNVREVRRGRIRKVER